jgi:DNA-binding YbaB/EbfC family protein
MKQAQKMQAEAARIQAELAAKTVEFTAGGGALKVVAKGDGTLAGITVDKTVLNPDDVEMLQDLLLAGVNGALDAAKKMADAEMSKLTAGLQLPPGLGF